MELLASISKFGIYVIFGVTLIAAFLTVTVRNIFHAALGLVFSLLGVAATYFILRAEFLGAIQILLYVGAIMTLVIFAVMLTSRISEPSIPTSNRQRIPVAIGMVAFAVFLVQLVSKAPWPLKEKLSVISVVDIGQSLMGLYVFPFEAISIVLVVALIGAIVIARGD